jgi:hypothetical protein
MVCVRDFSGKVLFTAIVEPEDNKASLNIDDFGLATGLYHLTLTQPGKNYIKKFVVK